MAQSYREPGGKSTRSDTFSQKWGDDPFTALGHTQAPNALIEYAARLGLTPEECWLIVCLLRFKHTDQNPYPSQERLAELLGQSERTIRRLVEKLAGRGLMTVEKERGDHGHFTHVVYNLIPLRQALNECHWKDHPQERPEDLEPVAPLMVSFRDGPEPGYVYLLEGGGFFKIGKATDLDRRVQQIFPKLPFECRLLHAIASDDCLALERWLHRRFADCRRNGEWFQLDAERVRWFMAQGRIDMAEKSERQRAVYRQGPGPGA